MWTECTFQGRLYPGGHRDWNGANKPWAQSDAMRLLQANNVLGGDGKPLRKLPHNKGADGQPYQLLTPPLEAPLLNPAIQKGSKVSVMNARLYVLTCGYCNAIAKHPQSIL